MGPITMAEMNRIFAVTDELGLSREALVVPLEPVGEGEVRKMAGGKIWIAIPETIPLEEWLPALKERLLELGVPGPEGP